MNPKAVAKRTGKKPIASSRKNSNRRKTKRKLVGRESVLKFMELLIKDNNLLPVLSRNRLKPRRPSENYSKNLSCSAHFPTKTSKLLLMLCPSRSLSQAKRSSKKGRRVYNFMLLALASMTASKLSVENRPIWKPTRKESILDNLPSCVLLLELLQSTALKTVFFTALTGPPLNTLLRNQLKKEEKNSEISYQKSKFWLELAPMKKSNFATSWKKRLMAQVTTSCEKENKVTSSTWLPKEDLLLRKIPRKSSNSLTATISGRLL